MGVTAGVAVGLGAVVGGGGGSQIMGVTLGGGAGSQIIGPGGQQPDAAVLPYKTIRLKMAFCKSLGNLFHGAMVTSYREWGEPLRRFVTFARV
jgi:hypothetical protein